MKINLSDPLLSIGITSVVCSIPAFVTTIYRLWMRRGKFWADDVMALFSMLSLCLTLAGCFMHITYESRQNVMVAAYYIIASSFYTTVWLARLSILFSIVRVDPSSQRRRSLYIIAFIFCVVTLILEAQIFWVCEKNSYDWKKKKHPQCLLTLQVAILQLSTDIVADGILIVAPLRLLRYLSDVQLRRRLTVIFSSCLITTIVSLVHAVFVCVHGGPKSIIAAVVEASVSVIVCNVPLIAGAICRSRKQTPETLSGLRFASNSSKTTGRDVESPAPTLEMSNDLILATPAKVHLLDLTKNTEDSMNKTRPSL